MNSHSIRTLGKSVTSFLYRAAQIIGLTATSMVEAIPAPLPPMDRPVPVTQYVSRVHRERMPNSNREARRIQGIPHGTAGAKLARKALNGAL